MSNHATAMRLPTEELLSPSLPSADYLGPAEVTGVSPAAISVRLPSGMAASARMALAFPYNPVEGDTLLVIGKGPDHYVIGVLEGRGTNSLTFQGGVEIRAEKGPLTLVGDHGVEVRGPEVTLEAETLRMNAETLVQKLTSVYQRVSALLSVRARETETIVEETTLTRAKRATILTDESVSINGKQVNLG